MHVKGDAMNECIVPEGMKLWMPSCATEALKKDNLCDLAEMSHFLYEQVFAANNELCTHQGFAREAS
jgi:hypothetical protein